MNVPATFNGHLDSFTVCRFRFVVVLTNGSEVCECVAHCGRAVVRTQEVLERLQPTPDAAISRTHTNVRLAESHSRTGHEIWEGYELLGFGHV